MRWVGRVRVGIAKLGWDAFVGRGEVRRPRGNVSGGYGLGKEDGILVAKLMILLRTAMTMNCTILCPGAISKIFDAPKPSAYFPMYDSRRPANRSAHKDP